MKVLSLFDGVGTGLYVLKKLGIKVERYFASEIKPHALKVSSENHKDIIHIGDIKKVSYTDGVLKTENGVFEVGEIDLIIGGSPCQNFSRACIKEKRLGLEGEKSKLFYEYLRILNEVKPNFFLLENVKMDKESEKELNSYLGVEAWNFNSKLISPSFRNRNYWTNIDFEKDIEEVEIYAKDIIQDGYVPYKKFSCLLEGHSRHNSDKLRLTRRHLEKNFIPIVYKSKEHYEELIDHYNKNYRGLSAKEVNDKRDDIDNSIYDGVRVLNSQEMCLIQGFNAEYCDCVTTKQAASLMGDGWTVDVIAHILKGLK